MEPIDALALVAMIAFFLSVVSGKANEAWDAVRRIGVASKPSDCCVNIINRDGLDHRSCITWNGLCVLCKDNIGRLDPPSSLVFFATCLERAIDILWV